MLSVTPISPPNGPGGKNPATSKELPLTLPAVLGRGPLLKCSDVKVSRRHASIDWADADDDGVTIEALFSQPTFVEVAGVRSKLQSGEKATLKHGDTFGLLPHAAWYRINFPGAMQHEDNTSEAPETNNSTPQDSGVETESGPSPSTSDLLVLDKSHVAAAQPSKSHTLPMDDGSSSDTKMEAAMNLPPCAADEIDSSAASPSATKKESVQPSPTTTDDVTNKVEETSAKSTTLTTNITTSSTANTPNPTPPTAPSSRARTLPSWMTQEPAATSSPKQQPPAAASKKKNTTRRKPRVKVAPPKRGGAQLSFSDDEDDSASHSPVKDTKSSPNRSKSKENKNASKRALHQLSESDDEDPPDATAPKTATSYTKIAASTSSDGASNVSSAVSNVPSANSSAKNTNVDAQNNSSGLHTSVTKAKQSQPRVSTADGEQASVSDAGRPARNGTNSANTRASAPNSVERKSCVYGASCYRRNPQHKKDEAHPGDPDYTSGGDVDNEDSDDDRPHCEFGVDCYRKNPEHRRQYKHTRIPQPQRRAKRKRAAQKYGGQHSDSDTPDEFDLEFLNDASSDDYAPSDSGGSDSERFPSQPLDEDEKNEMKRMGKEAKKFIKRGK